MEPYYYNQMNKIEKSIYQAMKAGITAISASFYVPLLEIREMTDIFIKLRLDHPEIFYAVSFQCRYYPNSTSMEVLPEYLFDQGKIKEHQKALKSRIEKLIRPAQEMTELQKEQFIHDFICTNIRYDKLKKQYSHEIIGPLGHGVGVCEGIAKTVKILCDYLDIWCIIAFSEANPEKKIKYRHAWNVIRIGGKYYHLDVTFDNTLSHEGVIRYDYFNLEDKQFFRDHEPVMYGVPQCNEGGHFYYLEKKQSFTKIEDVAKRAVQAIKKKKVLVFHWRGGYLTRSVLTELLVLLEETAKEKRKHAKTNLNWPQAVFCVFFTDEESGGECIVEAVNEGETDSETPIRE